MGGCVVPFCNNSSAKGYSMITFPKNPIRRALWAQNVPAQNWTLSNYSRICEIHFAPEMWNVHCKRKKLKPDAIPTIFGFFLKKQHTENNDAYDITNIQNNEINQYEIKSECTNDQVTDDIENKDLNIGLFLKKQHTENSNVHEITNIQNNEMKQYEIKNECTNDQVTDDIENEDLNIGFFLKKQHTENSNVHEITTIKNNKINQYEIKSEYTNDQATDDIENEDLNIETVINDISEPTTSSVNASCVTQVYKIENKELKKYKELVNKQYIRLIVMRRKLKAAQNKIRMLQNRINNTDTDKYKKALSKIFTEDQINALLKKTRIRNFSNETIQRAIRLRFICGTHGYKELLKQGFPFPSIRTLNRKLKDSKSQVSIDTSKFLKYKKLTFKEETDTECDLVINEMAKHTKTT